MQTKSFLTNRNIISLAILILGSFYPNKIKNAIIRPNSAIASVKAKPKIAYENRVLVVSGFSAIERHKAPNKLPIPIPEPASEIVAKPAPINLKACKNIYEK